MQELVQRVALPAAPPIEHERAGDVVVSSLRLAPSRSCVALRIRPVTRPAVSSMSTGLSTNLVRCRRMSADDHRLPRALHHGARTSSASTAPRRRPLSPTTPATWAEGRRSTISDDEIRDSLESAQLKLQRERGTDLTLFSPRASWMGHHIGNIHTSTFWTEQCNELVARVCDLYPDNFAPVCQLPQSPGAPIEPSVHELRRCVEEMGFVGCNLNPDPVRRATGTVRHCSTATGIRSTRPWSSSTCRR